MSDHQDKDIPTPRFIGIFTPAEILEAKKALKLSYFEMFLLSWIDAYYSKKYGGCFASNKHLSEKMDTEENTIAKGLTRLRKLKLVEDVSFDGRRRVIRALIGRTVDQAQSIQGSIGQPSNPPLDNRPSQVPPLPYSDIKEYKQAINTVQNTSQSSEQPPEIVFSIQHQEFLGITDKDKENWGKAYPSTDIEQQLQKAEEWCKSEPTKAKLKKKWRKFITNWLSKADEKAMNQKAYKEIHSFNKENAFKDRASEKEANYSKLNKFAKQLCNYPPYSTDPVYANSVHALDNAYIDKVRQITIPYSLGSEKIEEIVKEKYGEHALHFYKRN